MSQRVTLHHVIGKAAVKGRCYHGLPITHSVQDNQFCAVNPRFIAVVTKCTGGGAFSVIPIRHTGRVSPLHARVCGHSARVLDVKWDPFNDLRIASCSEDCTVKVWEIPQNGLKENLMSPCKELVGHSRRVALVEWHPTAKDLLFSAAYDCKVLVWRLDTTDTCVEMPVFVINTHSELVLCLSFNANGSLLATTCKDKKIRVIDPRTCRVLQESRWHSHKPSKILFLWDLKMLLTTGTSFWNQRQFALWDLEDLSEPLLEEDLEGGSSVVFPFYDPDTHMVYLAGKGDGNVRYYEVSAVKPYIHLLGEYQSSIPQRGIGVMPKRGLNIRGCEIFRFYRLIGIKNLVEPLSFFVPRKTEGFHEDIYPMTVANKPAMTAQEWLNGANKGPLFMSLKPEDKVHPFQQHDSCLFPENPDNQPADLSHDIITDMRDWTEDDTQSHNWMSSDLNVCCGPSGEKTEVLQDEIKDLQEQLQQRDNKIQQLEMELRNMRINMRASF